MKLVPIIVTVFILLVETTISLSSVFLPSIKSDFALSAQMAQMTLGIGLFALGLSGMIYGGLSDSFGRRPMFIISILMLTVSTLICALSESFTLFMIAKFMQGLGCGAGWVIGNACLKDLYHDSEYIKIMNIVHAIAGITPAVIPVLGSYLVVAFGWRDTFVGLFILAMILSAVIIVCHPETIAEKQIKTGKQICLDYVSIFKHHKFLRYCTIKVLSVTLIFCEISTLPLVFINHLDVPTENYGFYLLPSFLCYIGASILSSKMAKNTHVDRLLKIGLSLIIISNSLLLAISHYYSISAIYIQCIKLSTYAGWGFIFGNATAQIVSSIPGKAGFTSAMMIALEMLFSASIVYFLGFFFDGTMMPLSFCMVLLSTICFMCLGTPKRKSNTPQPPTVSEIL